MTGIPNKHFASEERYPEHPHSKSVKFTKHCIEMALSVALFASNKHKHLYLSALAGNLSWCPVWCKSPSNALSNGFIAARKYLTRFTSEMWTISILGWKSEATTTLQCRLSNDLIECPSSSSFWIFVYVNPLHGPRQNVSNQNVDRFTCHNS